MQMAPKFKAELKKNFLEKVIGENGAQMQEN